MRSGRVVDAEAFIGGEIRMRDRDNLAVMPTAPTRPKEEVARLGGEIYERDIRQQVEMDHHGEIVSIDVESGNWAIAGDILQAVDRLRAECPEAIDIWSLRVGYRASHKFGGGSLVTVH